MKTLTRLTEQSSVPTPTAEFEIDGNTKIERFESYIPRFACNGQPNKIGFTVNEPVQLSGIGLNGCCENRSVTTNYKVEIEIKIEKTGQILGSQSGDYECLGAGPYMVVFRTSITLMPKTIYVITAKIKGPDSYMGINGRQYIKTKLLNDKKLKVEFSDVYGMTNTTVKWDYTPTDLEFEHDREKHIVTIRKPGAYVFREFRIDIHT